MTFLNPFLLIALLAVFIPLIIHLLNLRKAVKIEFSTIMFLKEVKEKEIHKIKIKELILLLIRILIITFLVLSFSKPFIKSEKYGSASINKTGIILVDNSFSMNVNQGDKKLIEIERNILFDILKNFNPTDNIIILNSDSEYNYRDIIDTNIFKISYTPFSIFSLFGKVESIIKRIPESYLEIFILSDFQEINFKLENFVLDKNSTLKNANFYLIPVLKRQTSNIGILGIENLSGIIDTYTESKFRLRIKNFNNNQVTNKRLNIFCNDSLVLEKYLTFQPEEIQNVDFNFTPEIKDLFYIIADIQNIDNTYDDFIEDNKYYYIFNLPQQIKVFIYGENIKDSEFLNIAIKSFNSIQSREVIVSETSNKLPKDLSNYDVLIINCKSNLNNEEISKIKDFHDNGGGILIFPSINADLDNFNSFLQLISSIRLQKLIDVYNKDEIKLKFSEFNHYISEGIFKFKNKDNSETFLKNSPQISKYYKLINPKDAIPIIKINDEDYFLSETSDSYSPVLFFAVSSNLLMSDFPLSDIFPVLIIKSIYYLSNKNISNNIITGKNGIIYTMSDYDFIKKIDNSIIHPEKIYKGFASISATNELNNPGIYLLSDSSGLKKQFFTINIDTTESKIKYLADNEINSKLENLGFQNINLVNDINKLEDILYENRTGKDLTNLFLYLAIIFIILEIMFIKVFFKK